MKTREEILAALKAYKPELMKKYPIKSLALFGSYARNEATEESDIDVLIDLTQPLGLRFLDIAYDLEDLLHTKVDLVTTEAIKPRYKPFVEKNIIYV